MTVLTMTTAWGMFSNFGHLDKSSKGAAQEIQENASQENAR